MCWGENCILCWIYSLNKTVNCHSSQYWSLTKIRKETLWQFYIKKGKHSPAPTPSHSGDPPRILWRGGLGIAGGTLISINGEIKKITFFCFAKYFFPLKISYLHFFFFIFSIFFFCIFKNFEIFLDFFNEYLNFYRFSCDIYFFW